MGLRSFYFKQEEKYFKFLDRMEKKGINLYKIVDPLEKNGIPTFLVFNLIILFLIIFLVFLLIGSNPVTDQKYSLTFVDSQDQPFSNQEISILLDNNRKLLLTDNLGIAEVSGVEIKSYNLAISGEKYTLESPLTIDFKKNNSYKVFLKSKVTVLSKTIYFKNNNELYSSPLTVSSITCSNNTEYTKSNLQTNDGSLNLTDVPSDCGYLEVVVESSTVNAIGSLEVSQDSPSGEVTLSFDAQKTGSAKIIVLDKDLKVPIQNIEVSIVNNLSQVIFTGVTNQNGLASFEEINIGTYKLLLYDNDERYKPITELENIKIVINDSVLEEKEVILEKAYIGKLKYKVVDSQSKEAIENVATTIYKGNNVLKTTNTNTQGEVSFGVEENISFKVVFNNPNYIIKTENNQRISDSVKQISLTPITSENIKSLVITVVDDLLKPVDFATIRLWDEQEDIVLKTMTADVYGKAVLTNLDLDRSYKLDATKGQFSSTFSNPFRISEQEVTEQTIKMSIGEGTFNITVTSEYGDFYQGNLYVYDASNNMIIQDKTTTTNKDGFTLIKIRADKQVYFVMDNLDSKFITPMYSINAEGIETLNFEIPRNVGQTSGIEFIGFYNADGEKTNSVNPGSQVTAKYLLNVTRDFSKVVAHIRTGAQPNPLCSTNTYTVLEDLIFIKDVRFAKYDKIGSTTFTPCNGETSDFSNKTLRNTKWFNLTLNKPIKGSYLIEADVVVLDTVFSNQAVNYRAEFHEGSNIIRSPVDSSYTGSSSKQKLYAQTKQVQLSVGSQSQCTSLMCYSFSIINNQNNLSRNIVDSYKAKLNNDYTLSFSLNIMDGKIAPNSVLTVSSGDSVLLDDYAINSKDGALLTGKDFSSIELGSLTSNDLISGQFDFSVIDDVSDAIDVSVVSNNEVVFTKKIYLEIDAAKEMFVEFVPRKIVPFVSNDLLVVVTDDSNNFVSNAIVELSLNNKSLTVGSTNKEGLFGYVLPATDLSDVLKIVVKKDEYRTNKTEIVIDDKLITVVPGKIDLTLDSSLGIREVYNLSLKNESFVPLTIVSASVNQDNEYVDFDLGIDEYVINGVSQNEISLTATLTDKGVNLYNQQTINTEVAIKIKSLEMNKIWVLTVPLNVRIVLGNSLDSLECLKVLPVQGELRAKAKETKTLDFTLENTCTSKQIPVDLGSIFAKIDWQNETETGVVSLVVSGKEYVLEDLKETEIFSTLLKKSKTTLQLKFKAHNIVSASQSPSIYFSSDKGNNNGVDRVVSKMILNTVINDYSQCIEIPKQPIPALACNWFSGFNNYGNLYGGQNLGSAFANPYYGGNNFQTTYNPTGTYNRGNYYQQGPGYQTQQQGVYNPHYNLVGRGNYTGQQNSVVNPYKFPSSQYVNTFGNNGHNYNFLSGYPQGNYGNMGFSNNMNCPTRPFYIKNNCSEEVDIKLDSSYGVTITSESEFTLEPGSSQETTILGGEAMGTFKVPVNAKASKGSKETYSLLGDVLVSVTLPISFMSSHCIQVSPQKLDFSNIVDPKYQTVKIINSCFAQGYRLAEVSYLDLIDLNFDGVSFLNVGDMQGKIQPIKVDTLTNTTTNEPMEVWEIALRRNPEIENTASVKNYLQKYSQYSIASGIISSFRKILIDVEDAVNLKFILQVGLQPPTGQASLIYNNIGMELKDNFQWLILDNPDNMNLLKDMFGDSNDDIPIDFISISDKLTYTLDPNNKAVIINVPESELTADKFDQIDQEETTKRCFFGYVKDFPINGITETSFIKNNGLYYLNNKYAPLDVSIEFVTKNKNIFELCFTRPVESYNNILGINGKLNIYDFFKTAKTSTNNQSFELWNINDSSRKSLFQGHTLIGVKTIVSTNELGEGSQTTEDPGQNPSQVTGDDICLAPDLSEDAGFTGSSSYKRYGFDKILFEYSQDKITSDSCQDYFCDQEQFYVYLSKKADELKDAGNSNKYIKINGIYFEKNGLNIVENSSIELDLCANGVCDLFDVTGKETLIDYIDQANRVLEAVPDYLKKITIIKTKGLTAEGNLIVQLGNYQYTTADYFLDNYDSFNLTDVKKLEVYANMDVFYGTSPMIFVSKLKKFSEINGKTNKEILNNFNTSVLKNYTVKYSDTAYNIYQAGSYVTTISLQSPSQKTEISVSLSEVITPISDEYMKNILFTYPINPEYTSTKRAQLYKAPFIAGKNYSVVDYSSTDNIQKGYIFRFKDMADYEFIDSRPFYFNKPYDFKIMESTKEIRNIVNESKLFLLKDRTNKNVFLYANPQITSNDTKNNTVFLKTNINNNYMIYNLQMENVNPKIKYTSVKDVFDQINKGNVCFNISEESSSELMLWHNPDKFK